jgi:hypothetical protein
MDRGPLPLTKLRSTTGSPSTGSFTTLLPNVTPSGTGMSRPRESAVHMASIFRVTIPASTSVKKAGIWVPGWMRVGSLSHLTNQSRRRRSFMVDMSGARVAAPDW